MTVDHHAMQLDYRDPCGEEEWVCPHCGRRVRVTWPADLARHDVFAFDEGDDHLVITGSPLGVTFVYKEVVAPANEHVVHHFARFGDPVMVTDKVTPLSSEMRAWLVDAGFESWWQSRLCKLEALAAFDAGGRWNAWAILAAFVCLDRAVAPALV